MPPPFNNQIPGNLFTAIDQGGVVPPELRPNPAALQQPVGKGSLISFSYLYHKPGHDPTPLVIVTGVYDHYIRGVNLHYLTFTQITRLLSQYGNNPTFSYQNVKADEYIVGAFRQYKRLGMSQMKRLDSAFLVKVLQSVRSIDPTQVEIIRRAVRDQINRVVNPPARATVEEAPTPAAPDTPGT